MFVIIENYKKMLLWIIKNQLESTDWAPIRDSSFNGDSKSDLKALKKVADDWVDPYEANVMAEKADLITGEAKVFLKDLIEWIYQNWFIAKDENSYNWYKKLLAKSWHSIPECADIKNILKNNSEYFEWYVGLQVKWNKINILYWDSKKPVVLTFEKTKILDQWNWKKIPEQTRPILTPKINTTPPSENTTTSSEQTTPLPEITQKAEATSTSEPTSTVPEVEQSELTSSTTEELNKSTELIQILVEKNPKELSIKDWKVYLKHKCPNWKIRTSFFTIDNNPKINTEETFNSWVDKRVKQFNKEEWNIKILNDKKKVRISKNPEKNDIISEWNLNSELNNNEELTNYQKTDLPTENNQELADYEKTDSIPELMGNKLEQIKKWFLELFRDEKDIHSFIWRNGEEVIVEYDSKSNKLSFDTPYFDDINDFDLSNIPSTINSKEAALKYVKSEINVVKKQYDDKVIDNAIKHSGDEKYWSSIVSTFKVDGVNKPLNIRLGRDTDVNWEFKWIYIAVDTFMDDWIPDKNVTIKINWEVTKEKIDLATKNLEETYRILYNLKKIEK